MQIKLENINTKVNELLKTGDYYVSIKKDLVDYEKQYWGQIVDPDGRNRDRTSVSERLEHQKDCEYIYDYLKLFSGNLLDIGCGLGYLLEGLSNNFTLYGTELSKYAAHHAKQFADVFVGEVLDASYKESFFDVIIMHHVIEHLPDPILYLKKIKTILKKDGLLIIGTPDFDSGCARLFQDQYRLLHDKTHISFFSNDSMTRCLRDHQFKIDQIIYPFFETRFFTKNNLLRLFDKSQVSPPFYGNFMTFFAKNIKGN